MPKISAKFERDTPNGDAKMQVRYGKNRSLSTNNSLQLENGTRQTHTFLLVKQKVVHALSNYDDIVDDPG